MRLFGPLCFFLLIPLAAGAQDYNRADIVRGLCQKNGCAEFALLEKKPYATGADGELFQTRVQTFHASNQGRVSQGEEKGYVYCSSVRPAIVSAPEGHPPVAVFLAPDDQSPAYIQRSTTNFYALYFALCHGLEAGKNAVLDRQAAARSFGYHVALSQPQTVTLKQIEDILKPH
jgi:hypothetical protein